jgi:hypothetical protein
MALALAVLGLAACDEQIPTSPSVTSADALIASLTQQGATVVRVELMPPNSFRFMSVRALRILVNGASVSVFEYDTAAAANADAARVSRDGSIIGDAIIDWIDVPRFTSTIGSSSCMWARRRTSSRRSMPYSASRSPADADESTEVFESGARARMRVAWSGVC